MKTKKILTIILCLSMLFIFAVPVSASSTTASIRVTSVGEIVVGSIVSVPIVLEENSGFVSLSVKILFDSAALTLETVTDTGKLIGGCFEGYYDSPYYLVWENDIATKNNTYTGEIATLQFRVNEDAKPGTYSVEIIMDDYGAIDKDGNSVKFSLYSGTITITESKHQCSFGDWGEYSAKKHIRYCNGCDEYELEAHSYVSWKNYDDEQHKRSCSCGEVEYEDHNWNNGVTSANIITYTCEDCEATKTEAIAPDTVPVTGITLSNSELTVTVGENAFIDAIIAPSNATNQIISWASNNASVASIGWMVEDKTHGVISAKAVGTATITATTEDGNFVAQCVVTVIADEPTPNPDAPTIYIDNVTSAAGKTVEVNIALKNNPGILGASFTLSYSEELTLISAQKGEALSSLTYTAPGVLSNPCRFGWDGVDESNADGVVLTLTFKIPDDAKQGDSYAISVSYENGNIFDNSMNAINFGIENGSIKIPEYTSGDLNDDGVINMQDVVLLRRHIIGGYNVVINDMAADVNRDGLLNMQDVVLIRRYIVGGYGVELK